MRRTALPLGLSLLLCALACGEEPGDSPDGGAPDAGKPDGSTPIKPTGDAGSGDSGMVMHPPDAGDAGQVAPFCGDATCNGAETCFSCERDCGACPVVPCSSEGGLFCGGNTVGGDPRILYVCRSGSLKLQQECGAPCQYMPSGIPDRCPAPITPPESLVSWLNIKPYVEQNCSSTTFPGWPHAAQRCTFTYLGQTATATVAIPSPERVARWIVDSATYIPPLNNLKDSNPYEFAQGLKVIAYDMQLSSARIFPLDGSLLEDTGGGVANYPFDRGVTKTCSSCFCNINSVQREGLCDFRAAIGVEARDACLAKIGGTGWTQGWGDQCMANHARAFEADANEHFRAKAYLKGLSIRAACPPNTCSPAQVVTVTRNAFGI